LPQNPYNPDEESFIEYLDRIKPGWGGRLPSPSLGSTYPDRISQSGGDIHIVQPGESWPSIARDLYRDDRYVSELQRLNNSISVLHPGMKILLPDRREDPLVPVPQEDFWNGPDFANEINAMDDRHQLIQEARHIEQIWPNHGDPVYIGFDENNDPYPTTDNNGMQLYWDPATKEATFDDTGVLYTMGMVDNDFIKPLTIEEQRELTMLGEQRFRQESMAYYAQAAESDEFKGTITEKIPEDSVFLPSLNEARVPTSLETSWWESIWDGIAALTEEPIRGIANIIDREGKEGREGYNILERGSQIIVSMAQSLGPMVASGWSGLRETVASIFNREVEPYPVDIESYRKLTPVEVSQREEQGLSETIRYVTPHNYWALEMDRATTSALRWTMTAFDGHFTGIYKDQFDSDQEFEDYIRKLYAFEYGEDQDEAIRRNIANQKRDEGTRLDALEQKQDLITSAFEYQAQGKTSLAIQTMEQAMRLQTQGAHWYSPYFMWSEMNEPWRHDKFMSAIAIATLENGEELDPRAVRSIRRQYEHVGLDIAMGVYLDVFQILNVAKGVKVAANGIMKFIDILSDSRAVGTLKNINYAKPVTNFLKWLTHESHGSAGTSLKRIANNLSFNVARSVDATLSQPGVRGLDETMDSISQYVRLSDEAIEAGDVPFESFPANVSEMHLNNARKLISIYDETSELPQVRKINPDNWGGLVDEAYQIIWQNEYNRAMLDLRKSSPETSIRELQSIAARNADVIASKPKLVAREFGNFFEDAYRAIHQTPLGPSTLDDNPFMELSKKLGVDFSWAGKGFKLFYGARNFLFEWWLSLRPAWTAINYIDSSVRSLISGAKLYDGLGFLNFVNVKKLLGRNLIREEFLSTFTRGLKEVEEGTSIRLEPAVDRLLRGRRFTWGPLSVFNDARKETILAQRAVDQGRLPTGSAGKVARWLWDQMVIAKQTLNRGAIDINSLIEFGLRERVFATHYDNAIVPMDKLGIQKLVDRLTELGASPDTIQALRKLWFYAGDDADHLKELLDSAIHSAERPQTTRLFSEILPDNFEEGLEALGVDRRLRELIFKPIIHEVEDIIRNSPNTQSAVSDIESYINDSIRAVNDEFLRHIDELASQPSVVREESIRGGTAVANDLDETVNLGSGHDEVLTIRTEDLQIQGRTVYTMSEEYHQRGVLQREAMARLFDAKRELRTLAESGEMDQSVSLQAREYLDEVSEQTRLYRDRIKQFLLRVFPGPLKYSPGPSRRSAWDMFDRLGVQVYESVIKFTDESIEAAVAGRVDEIPSVENLLRESGIELMIEGGRLRAIRIVDDVMGSRTSFSGWRATNWIKKQLISSFFGTRVRMIDAGEWLSQPFTVDSFQLSSTPLTREEIAEQLASQFGDAVGEATDAAIRASDEAWHAFARNPDVMGGNSIRAAWGYEATRSRDSFLEVLDEVIRDSNGWIGEITNDLRALGATQEEIDTEVWRLVDHIEAIQLFQDEIRDVSRTLDTITNPLLESLAPSHARLTPTWIRDYGIQTFLNMQRGLAAERRGIIKALESLQTYLVSGLSDGSLDLVSRRLNADQLSLLEEVWTDAVYYKQLANNIAADGVDAVLASENMRGAEDIALVEEFSTIASGSKTYAGAVNKTQFDMLEYGKNYRFDNLIKFVSPFWMFQSRSPLFWIKAFGEHPDYLAWASRYHRYQRKEQINQGATDSSGRPLNRFYGYWRIPGTTNWVAPLNPISARYVFPRPSPYPSEFADDISPSEMAITYVYEYGRMYGFNPAPWITYLLNPDENRIPRGGLIMHVDLIPPWIQRDIRRLLQMQRYPNDPGLINPDVGWKDYLIQKEMFGIALMELEENPDEFAKIQQELYDALGYKPTELDEFGMPLDYESPALVPYRESPRWIAARDRIERDQYYNQLLGFFTGIYPKEYTDAEAALLELRDEINFMKESINSVAGVPVFGLDPVAESRYEMYMNKRWDTPEGYLNSLYGAIRWTQSPTSGEQLYGEERADLIAQRIWENEVTQAYYDSLGLAQDEFDACQKGIKIGQDSAVQRSCWSNLFQRRAQLDNEPIFDLARRDWAIGYKTDQMIKDRFDSMWWSYINSTKPKWYDGDGEPYSNWQARTEEWLDNLPDIASELAPVFLVQDIKSRTGFEGGEDEREIPGSRILMEETVIRNLVQQTNREGYDEWQKSKDDPFDAMNAAFKALRWDPYMKAVEGWDQLNTYERDLAEQAFLDKHGSAPEFSELARWVFENYPENQFTVEELQNVFSEHGISTIEEKTLPNTEKAVIEDGIWDMLSGIGPGENSTIFQEEFILAGGDKDLLDAWYETGGHLSDFNQITELHQDIQSVVNSMGLKQPSSEHLVEWAAAKRLNDAFRDGVINNLGENVFNIIGIYGSLKGDRKREYKNDNAEVIDEYFDMRNYYAEQNQLWAKYYNPDKYLGGVGIPGQGAEARGEAISSGVVGRGRKSSFTSGGGRSGGAQPDGTFIAQGYRSTYDPNELFDPERIGRGGVGGVPYWPPGFGKGKPQEVLTDIVKMIGNGEPLPDYTINYLERTKSSWEEYVEELLKYNEELRGMKLGGGGKVLKL